MSLKKLKKYLPLIELLGRKNLSRECFVSLFESFNDDAVKFICECVQNAISCQHVSQLIPKERHSLIRRVKPYKQILKKLCKTKNAIRHTKKLLFSMDMGCYSLS